MKRRDLILKLVTKQLMLCLFLIALLIPSSYGAGYFGGDGDRFLIGSSSSLTLPDGDFTFFLRIKPNISSWPTWSSVYFSGNADGYFNVAINSSEALFAEIGDDDLSDETAVGTAPGAVNDTDQHSFAIRRSGTTWTTWFDGSQTSNTSLPNFDAITSVFDSDVGAYSDASEPTNAVLSDLAIWKRALSDGELESLMNDDYSPACFPSALELFMPMIEDFNEIASGLTVTNTNVTPTVHPRTVDCR